MAAQVHTLWNFTPLLFLLLLLRLIISSQAAICPSPAIPVNAQVTLYNSSLATGTIASFTCDSGYTLFGSSTRKCTESGAWEGELPFCAVNIAYRKPANQSTTVRGGDASNAVDGNSATLHEGKYCTETRREISPWWRVDLLQPYEVRAIQLTTRKCCGQRPLRNLEIRVGNTTALQKSPLCSWFPGALEEGITVNFTCPSSTVGRYVFIQLIGVEGFLSLCEVQVFTTQEFSRDRCANYEDPDHVAAFSKTCYSVHVKQGGSFAKARKACLETGGDLVHRLRNTTQHFLSGELERLKGQMSTQLLWIGATKDPGLAIRTWKWVSGEVITKPLWGEDQPNNYNGEQNCIVFDGGRGWLWNDVGCNLDYLLWVCQYKASTCGSPDLQENTTIVGSEFSVGKVIEYQCPVDSMVLGTTNRTCLSSGFWDGAAPSCKYINCQQPEDIEHGKLELLDNRTTFAARAKYTCQGNFTLLGPELRRCGADEKWEGKTPECHAGMCSPPTNVSNATMTVSGMFSGDNVTYTCHLGHFLQGTANITCLLGGKWSDEPPKCKYVDCGLPPPMKAGVFFLPDNATFFKSRVTYRCADNHVLRGRAERTCESDGRWSGEEPSCEIISCGEPDVNVGSYVVGYEFTVGALVEYFCDPGHLMEGESNRTCSPSGNWTGTAPKCTYVDCGRVQPIPYAVLDYVNGSTHVGSVVIYECTASYQLKGTATRTCRTNGKWDGATPSCTEIRCPEPARPVNSILSVSGNDRAGTGDTFKIGSTVQRRCEKGFRLQGEAIQTCEANGQWSSATPICIYVECGQPEGVADGEVLLATNATSFGNAAMYICSANFELIGEAKRLCLENGTWSGKPPVCEEITCGPPDKPPSVDSVEAPRHSAGSLAKYSCARGQRLTRNGTRVCERSGKWSDLAPECKWVDCGRPMSVENGRIYLMNQTTTYNSTIEYHCFPAYKLEGQNRRWCQDEGSWSGQEPLCHLDVSSNVIHGSSSASTGPQDENVASAKTIGIAIGVGSGILLLILIGVALIYMRMRAPKPIGVVENDKDDAVVAYAAPRGGPDETSNGHPLGTRGNLVNLPS